MKQHTFSVGNKPRVVVRHVEGNLIVHSWNKHSIDVRIIGENEDGSTAQPYNEGETVYLNDCKGDIELYVPYDKTFLGHTRVTTDISVTDLNGAVAMENVGNVDLATISGSVTLTGVDGTLRATDVPALRENKGIGGSALLENISLIEIGVIGAALQISNAETVKVGTVGGATQAKRISALFHCGTTGGSCEVYDSPNAEVSLSNVGGSLHISGVARLPSCTVGGSLSAKLASLLSDSNTHLTIGGSATLGLPRNADLTIHIMAGGSISGEAVQQKRNNMATLTYGNGSASLSITAGGSVKLDWASASEHPDRVIPFDGPADAAQRREAILKMVEQGRISPDEGNMLLEALDQ